MIKLGVTYLMSRKDSDAETYIAIPADEKYKGLAENRGHAGGRQFGRATLEGIIQRLTQLQGYDKGEIEVIEIEE